MKNLFTIIPGEDIRGRMKIYGLYLGLAFGIVGSAFIVQVVFVYGKFDPNYIPAPLFVALATGTLLARVADLKNQLTHKNSQFRAIVELAEEFTYFRLANDTFEYISPAFEKISGHNITELHNDPGLIERLIHPDDLEIWKQHCSFVAKTDMPETLDIRIIHKNGETRWISHTAVAVFENGERIGIRSTNLDITQRKQFEDKISHLAFYDPLTNLPNRRLLVNRLNDLVQPEGGQMFAILFLDLDRFKYLNDTHGHSFGDRLLVELAGILAKNCGEEGLVARFGGDEFIILVPEISRPEDAVEEAKKILSVLENPVFIDGVDYYISGSIGISIYPFDGEQPEQLVKNADSAMYKSKKDSAGNIRMFNSGFVRDAASFLTMEGKIRKALKSGEFFPFYQPKVELQGSSIIGLEALARWQGSDGMVMPDKFISIAEETGLIKPLGKQILDNSCLDMKYWDGLPIAVNVSVKQFSDPDFISEIRDTIDKCRVADGMLELEITEQILVSDIRAAIKKLEELREMNVRVSIDDFGIGYSSLNYLKNMPIDTVKLDKSFIDGIGKSDQDMAVVKNIISLCNDLNVLMIAEGVETLEQCNWLKANGCRAAQGYYFHKPAPADKISELFA